MAIGGAGYGAYSGLGALGSSGSSGGGSKTIYEPKYGTYITYDKFGNRIPEPGLEAPLLDPVDLLAGGILSGPKGPLFGRALYQNGMGAGIFNRGSLRVGWSWDAATGRNWFSIHGGIPRTPSHWHFDLFPGPRGPLW